MGKKFTGVRKRVECERARYAIRVIEERGYTIKRHSRLGNDTGYYIRTDQGPIVNLYDTGSILISGKNRHRFGNVDALRMPDTSTGIIIAASADDEALLQLSMKIRAWGHGVEFAFFGQRGWMEKVGQARKRGAHVLVLVSSGVQTVADVSARHPDPDVSFGIGVIVARIEREHITVLCHNAVAMPHLGNLIGSEVMRYSAHIQEVDDRLRARLRDAGVRIGAQGALF